MSTLIGLQPKTVKTFMLISYLVRTDIEVQLENMFPLTNQMLHTLDILFGLSIRLMRMLCHENIGQLNKGQVFKCIMDLMDFYLVLLLTIKMVLPETVNDD